MSASWWLGRGGVLLQGGRLQPVDRHLLFPLTQLEAEELGLSGQDPVRAVVSGR